MSKELIRVAKFDISGLKCDNPSCDYKDDAIDSEDYAKWIGCPCPKCGENLLTVEDYLAVRRMDDFADRMNTVLNRWLPRKLLLLLARTQEAKYPFERVSNGKYAINWKKKNEG